MLIFSDPRGSPHFVNLTLCSYSHFADPAQCAPAVLARSSCDLAGDQSRGSQPGQPAPLPGTGHVMEADDQRVRPEQLRLQRAQAEERVRGPLQGAVKPGCHRCWLMGRGEGSVVMLMVTVTAGMVWCQ